jgi:hypothetical protein
MTFRKGESGNPGGRAKLTLEDGRTLSDLAKEHTAEAVDCLVDVMRDRAAPHAARVTASTAVLDRAWGRPKQEFEGSIATNTELAELIAQRRAHVIAARAALEE